MQNYTTILGVVELRLQDVGYATIQSRYNIGSSTVTLIMKRYRELGIPLETLYGMPPKSVELAFYPPENLKRSTKPMPDFVQIHARMLSMKQPNLGFLWLEYKEKNPDGYQLSQFYEMYRTFVAENYGQTSVTMPVERIPGERMYIDWVGDQPELLLDTATGELKKVHIFAATLGFSSCVYAEAFLNEKLSSFISGVVHALSFYDAVPKYLVPDNLKTAVTKHSKDELVLNSVFSDLEDFYDTVVLPPPPRKPKGKPTVENHVRYLETHLIEKLKEKAPFSSIEAINEATEHIIADINQRDFKNQRDIRKSRQHAFETYDKPQMKHLPAGHFTVCDYKYFLRVPENYHLEYDGHYYSVMYTMHGKPALLKATMSEIRICDENNRLLCTHTRSYKDFPRYITDDSHMPAEHQYYKELNAHDGAYYRRWATSYGDAMVTLIDRILRGVKHEEQAYNSCKGILHMCDDVPHHIAEEAAQTCIDASACKYTYFKKVLSRIMNHEQPAGDAHGRLPQHENIRGRDSYK